MKELIASLLLSFFIAETAQAIVINLSEANYLKSNLDSIKFDLD
jgi:hypothetical protein